MIALLIESEKDNLADSTTDCDFLAGEPTNNRDDLRWTRDWRSSKITNDREVGRKFARARVVEWQTRRI
jgi:hypothetical protein